MSVGPDRSLAEIRVLIREMQREADEGRADLFNQMFLDRWDVENRELNEVCRGHVLAEMEERERSAVREFADTMKAQIAALGEQIDRLERGSGAEGWIGSLSKEIGTAVVAAQEATELMRGVTTSGQWVDDLRAARNVLGSAVEAVSVVRAAAAQISEVRADARATLTMLRRILEDSP